MGRGGRVVLDRASTTMDDLWSSLDFKIFDSDATKYRHPANADQQQAPAASVAGLDGLALAPVKSEVDESDSVVVDLVTPTVNSRKYSVDSSVARTTALATGVGENIVIKSEQNTVLSIKQESLDAWASSATACSLPATPLSVSQHRFSALAPGAGTLFSAALRRTVSQSGAHPSNTSNFSSPLIRSAHANSSFNLTKSDSSPARWPIETSSASGPVVVGNCSSQPDDDTRSLPYDESTRKEDDMFSDFLSEIRRDWLHFRPKTPPPRTDQDCVDDLEPFGEPAIEYSDHTPLQVEIQYLGSQPPSAMLSEHGPNDANALLLLNDGNNVFLTNPFTLDELMDDTDDQASKLDASAITLAEHSLSSGNEANLSGDSLPELSLSLGESEANEKMLENILEECQFDDLKSFNTNANFWNGILEDAGALCEDLDDAALKKTAFDKIATDIIGATKSRSSKQKRHRVHSRIGCSSFSISNIAKDEFFKKEDPVTTTCCTDESALADNNVVEIKQECIRDDQPSAQAHVPSISLQNHLGTCPPLIGVSTPAQLVHPQVVNHSPAATNHKTFIKMEPPDEMVDTVKYVKNQLLPNIVKTEIVHSSAQLPQIVNFQPGGNIVIQHQAQQQHPQQQGIQLQLMQQQNKQQQQINLQQQLHAVVQQPQQQLGAPKTFVIQQQHQTIQMQPQNNQSVNTEGGTLMVANPSTIRRQANGPAEKNCKCIFDFEHYIRLLTFCVHCSQQPFKTSSRALR